MGVREQNHQNTSAKIRTPFYELKTQNSIFWKVLGNYMLGNSRSTSKINPFLPSALYFPESFLLISLSVIHLKLPVDKD